MQSCTHNEINVKQYTILRALILWKCSPPQHKALKHGGVHFRPFFNSTAVIGTKPYNTWDGCKNKPNSWFRCLKLQVLRFDSALTHCLCGLSLHPSWFLISSPPRNMHSSFLITFIYVTVVLWLSPDDNHQMQWESPTWGKKSQSDHVM